MKSKTANFEFLSSTLHPKAAEVKCIFLYSIVSMGMFVSDSKLIARALTFLVALMRHALIRYLRLMGVDANCTCQIRF